MEDGAGEENACRIRIGLVWPSTACSANVLYMTPWEGDAGDDATTSRRCQKLASAAPVKDRRAHV